MVRLAYQDVALVDTSAAIALRRTEDQFHADAKEFFDEHATRLTWCCVNVTSHESFTRARYLSDLASACAIYDFLRGEQIRCIEFSEEDEQEARRMLARYHDQSFSYHDALCGAVMKRLGIVRIFSFDKDFWVLGFEVMPGRTA